MLGVFLIGNLLLKLPVSISMILGAVAGALVAGEGIPIRHLFEGCFTYVDTILIISTAMLFMTAIQRSGALEALNALIVTKFYKVPALMLILLMFIVMFPGMITGSSTAAVLSAGAIVAPILLKIGIPKERAGAILAVGAIMGMAAPPVNIPAMLIAGGVESNIRELEGSLIRVNAYAKLNRCEINEEVIAHALHDIAVVRDPKRITPDLIIDCVADYYSLSSAMLRGNSRKKEIALARHVAVYLTREMTGLSLPRIGDAFGRDHSTIINSCDKVSKMLDEGGEMKAAIADLKKIITEK